MLVIVHSKFHQKSSGGESCRDFQRLSIHGCEFLEDFLQGISCEDDTEGVELCGCRIRYAYCYPDFRPRCRDHLEGFCYRMVEMGWKPEMFSACSTQLTNCQRFLRQAEGRGIFVKPTPAEAQRSRTVKGKTMPDNVDKWETKFLGILMCLRTTSRLCLTSLRMQRKVWCNRMDTFQGSGCSVLFLEF